MTDSVFVYVTYIAAPIDKVWQALTDGQLTRTYWGMTSTPDPEWTPGARWTLDRGGHVHVAGEVLETVPGRRLVLSWADPGDTDPARQTRVAMEIEQAGDKVKLTVTHDRLYPEMARRITNGWPLVCSSLKSFLETGQPLELFD